MLPKPKHLSVEYAAQFQDAAVIAAYPTRPPYPAGVFVAVTELVTSEPRRVLDVGCGTGDVARRLAPLVGHVDAIDVSAGMIALGKTVPGGHAPNLRWIVGAAEDAPLAPPYALVTAGESLHWMEWQVVLPRLRAALMPGGYLAIVERGEAAAPWRDGLLALMVRFSTNRDFQPYDLIAELETRGLFTAVGRRTVGPIPYAQPVDAYIESLHSRNGFSRDRMAPAAAAELDAALRALLEPHASDGQLQLALSAKIAWGLPAPH